MKLSQQIFLGLLCCATSWICATTFGQEAALTKKNNWRLERRDIEESFRIDLEEIAKWCHENELAPQARETLDWVRDLDLNRQYIFLPSEKMLEQPADDATGERVEWQRLIIDARKKQAIRVLELGTRAAKANAGAFAFQCLHEALYYDPDLAEVRKILGHRKKDDHWQVATGRLRARKATKSHSLMNWPKKSYLIVSTDHFTISSRATEEETLFLAESLEKWHLVWRQVFFEFWNRPETTARWISGHGNQRKSTKKFRVIFFANKEQYDQELSPKIPGIEVSTGYYNNSEEASYFFASDDERDTWRHEATHQWFSESIRSNGTQFENEHIWICEGIAMYFESLTDLGDYVTLGGFESDRLQFAARRIRERFFVPLEELANIGRLQLQQQQDIKKLYSQSAGMTHMLMNSNNGELEQQLISFLKLLYQGKLKAGAFTKLLGKTYSELDKAYLAYLSTPSDLHRFLSRPETRKVLAVTNKLQDSAYPVIGRCTELLWLDLSGNSVTGENLKHLASCRKLEQLFMTNCRVDAGTIRVLASLPLLNELDLIGSTVSDSDLIGLAQCKELTYVRLIGTRISDQGLQAMSKLPKLRRLDLAQTSVTAEGVARLQALCPQLEITH